MAHQNILTFYSRKLDIRVDKSQYFDYQSSDDVKIDLRIDNSDYIDYELDYTPDYELEYREIPILHQLTLSHNFATDDYYITNQDGSILMTQAYNELQFQF